ncbi:MAG: hypothetical protein D6693_03545 [Planctomycetota bacterium]|nr:MAG: hypothetical protein D6693_03545 [Planctomycetota bacterium]
MNRAWAAIVVVALAPMAIVGCATDPAEGYAFGTGHDAAVRTVSVPLWRNRTREPELGALLTEAIIKEINRSTPWRVADVGGATLTGVVTEASLRRLGRDTTTGLTQELAYDLAVDFTFRVGRRGRGSVIERRGFRAQGAFIPMRGAGEPIDAGRLAAVDALARDIVAELRSSW